MRIQWNKYGLKHREVSNTINGLTHRNGAVDAVYFCPNCGSEIFGEWKYTLFYNPQNINDFAIKKAVEDSIAEYSILQKEAESFAELNNCPLCNGVLIHDDGFFIQNDLTLDEMQFFTNPICRNSMKPAGNKAAILYGLDDICVYLKNARTKIDDSEAKNKLSIFTSKVDVSSSNQNNNIDADKIKSSPEELKRYLQQLVNLESCIISVSKRLPLLYRRQIDLKRLVNGMKVSLPFSIRREVELAEVKVKEAEQKVVKLISEPTPTVNLPKPSSPVAPTLQTPNLFNRKRVEAENEKLQLQYRSSLEQHKIIIQNILSKEEQIRKNNELKKQADIEKAKKSVIIAKKEHEIFKNDMQSKIEEALSADVPANALLFTLDNEIAEVESLLKNLYETRNRLYSFDIIYSKYRNIIAVATFCEYLITGRCSTLEGSDGAYNLYETECRSKIIISQLSQIIGSIDQLKETQYMLWEQLYNTSKEIKRINSITQSAFAVISEQLQDINNSFDLISYSSVVNAYYSRINAEIASSDRYISMICF